MNTVTLKKVDEVFDFGGSHVRVGVDEQGRPWFVAKDVAEVLGYMDTDDAVRNHCKKRQILKPGKFPGLKIPNRGLIVIPEADLYRLVMRSKLPSAMEFEDWVVNEVLPAIRKHGGYLTPQKIEEVLTDPDTIIQLANTLKEERAKRIEAEAKRLEAEETKAWIGSKREATAMNKASQLSKRVKKLEESLGDSEDYKAVTAIPWLKEIYGKLNSRDYRTIGQYLKKLSEKWGIPVRKIPDSRWGSVNAYHRSVIDIYRKEFIC